MQVEKHYPAKNDKITEFIKGVPLDLILAYIRIKSHDSETMISKTMNENNNRGILSYYRLAKMVRLPDLNLCPTSPKGGPL